MLWVTLADFPKLDDLSRERLTKWVRAVMPERRKRHLEGKAHETDGFVVEAVAAQEGLDRHESGSSYSDQRRSPTPRAGFFNTNFPAAKGPDEATDDAAVRLLM